MSKTFLVQCSAGCGKTSRREKPLEAWYCSLECEAAGPPQMPTKPDFDYPAPFWGPSLGSEESTKLTESWNLKEYVFDPATGFWRDA